MVKLNSQLSFKNDFNGLSIKRHEVKLKNNLYYASFPTKQNPWQGVDFPEYKLATL